MKTSDSNRQMYLIHVQKESPGYLRLHPGDIHKNIDCRVVHNSKIMGNKPSIY